MTDRIEFGDNSILEGSFVTVNGERMTQEEYKELLKKKKEEEAEALKNFTKSCEDIDLNK